MTLEEAVKHAEEVAEEHTKYNRYGGFESCDECAKEHRQLAEWLKELKAYRAREERAIRKRCPMVEEWRMTENERKVR